MHCLWAIVLFSCHKHKKLYLYASSCDSVDFYKNALFSRKSKLKTLCNGLGKDKKIPFEASFGPVIRSIYNMLWKNFNSGPLLIKDALSSKLASVALLLQKKNAGSSVKYFEPCIIVVVHLSDLAFEAVRYQIVLKWSTCVMMMEIGTWTDSVKPNLLFFKLWLLYFQRISFQII